MGGGPDMGDMGSQSSGATSVINDAIDTPFSITSFFDALLENEEYLAQYHAYLDELVEKYVNGGEFEKTYERIRSQIDELVKEDPTAFYTYDEYEDGANVLCEVVKLRAESVRGQLDGTIPSTDDGQKADSSSLIDGSGIDLSVMGTFFGGGGGGDKDGGGPGGFGGNGGENNGMFPGNPGGNMPGAGTDSSQAAGANAEPNMDQNVGQDTKPSTDQNVGQNTKPSTDQAAGQDTKPSTDQNAAQNAGQTTNPNQAESNTEQSADDVDSLADADSTKM